MMMKFASTEGRLPTLLILADVPSYYSRFSVSKGRE